MEDTQAREGPAEEAWYDSNGETSPEMEIAPLPIASPLSSYPLPTPRSAGPRMSSQRDHLHPAYPSVAYRPERTSRSSGRRYRAAEGSSFAGPSRRRSRRHSSPEAGPSETYLHPESIYRRSGRFSQRPTSDIRPLPRTDLTASARYPSNLDHSTDWSPHLWYDRRSTMLRRRTYIEPSINESLEGWGPTSRRNAQVWLFALGFLMPIAWIVAAFLPLPRQPGSLPTTPGVARDLEKQLIPEELRRFENARWWRNVNRWMVPVAVAILVAVIVLVVVAARTGM
jgi:hypothetical protein